MPWMHFTALHSLTLSTMKMPIQPNLQRPIVTALLFVPTAIVFLQPDAGSTQGRNLSGPVASHLLDRGAGLSRDFRVNDATIAILRRDGISGVHVAPSEFHHPPVVFAHDTLRFEVIQQRLAVVLAVAELAVEGHLNRSTLRVF